MIFDNSPYLALSPDGKQVIIKRFDTPRPWTNYLTNGDYTAIVTQMGAGFSFHLDSLYNQILFAGTLDLIEPVPGRYLYLRDNTTGEYWNPTVTPAMQKPDFFESRHTPGCTSLTSVQSGIRTSVRYFVPMEKDEEKWIIEIQNTTSRPRSLKLYSYCELVLGSLQFHRFGPIDYNLFNLVDWRDGVLTIRRSRHQDIYGAFSEWPHVFYAYASRKPQACEVSKESFVGRCRSTSHPQTVSEGLLKTNLSIDSQAIACFGWEIELAPGESQKLVLTLGLTKRDASIPVDRDVESAETDLQNTAAYWNTLLDASTITTPDAALNAESNCWIKYQSLINSFTWRTFISLYGCSGGCVFRNVVTDLYGIIPVLPAMARDTIIKIAAYIKSDGSPSQLTPRPEIGFKGNEAEKSDFLLWYLFVVADYVKETGDLAILDVTAPYMNGGSGTIYEHLVRGIDAVLHRKGMHGLPLIKFGDWNDALSAVGKGGKGESVWLAQFFYFVLGDAIDLFAAAGKGSDQIERYRQERISLKKSVNECCWNGSYFVRAFADDGQVVGDRTCEEGKIYLNPQVWAIIADMTDCQRMEQGLREADAQLMTDKGYALCSPAYTSKTTMDLGIIGKFAPGTKENGAIFSHANAFAVIAKAKFGLGKQAYDLYRRFSPFSRSAADIELAKIEPYVFCQYLNGPDSHKPGEGWYPWTTGTAAWSFRSVTDWIIGIRASYNGLVIDPCIDPAWDGFEAKRRFRGATYNITVSNPNHVEKGVKMITVDGRPTGTSALPLPERDRTYNVNVLMG